MLLSFQMTLPTVSALVVSHLVRTGLHQGLRTVPDICQSLTDGHQRVDVRARISTTDLELLWEQLMRGLQDPGFPVAAGTHPIEELQGLMGYLALAAPSVRLALQTLVRYWSLVTDACHWSVHESDCQVKLQLHLDGMPKQTLGSRCTAEYFLAGVVFSLLRATQGACRPTEVCIAHRPPSSTGKHQEVLGSVTFGGEQYTVVYPKYAMDFMLREPPGVLAGSVRHAEISRDVAALMEEQLRSSAGINIVAIAKRLAASTRTIQRRLAEDGTTFQRLLEDVRRRLAVELLSDPSGHAIKEIAMLLGFVAVRSFERAFRRWTGQTPGVWRQRNRQLDMR